MALSNYQRRRAAGRCTRCGRRRTHQVRCKVCKRRRSKASSAAVARATAHTRRVRLARAEACVCTGCGGEKPWDRFKSCADCRAVDAGKAALRAAARRAAGLCYCGKRQPVPGQSRCKTCLRRQRKSDRIRARTPRSLQNRKDDTR